MTFGTADRLAREHFPGADAVEVELMPGLARFTVLVGDVHKSFLRLSPRLGRAFLDTRRMRLLLDLLRHGPGMRYEVGYGVAARVALPQGVGHG